MRGCEADRCDAGATVNGRWCERHGPTEYALEAPTPTIVEWAQIEVAIAEAEGQLAQARQARRWVLERMSEQGLSLGDIAKVTGLTRQRIGQLLKTMP